jgi:hypothetical protein
MRLITSCILLLSFLGCINRPNKQLNKTLHKVECIKPWSENPKYWEYKNKPLLLLGAFNHGHNPFIDGSTVDTVNVNDLKISTCLARFI